MTHNPLIAGANALSNASVKRNERNEIVVQVPQVTSDDDRERLKHSNELRGSVNDFTDED